MIGTTIEPQAVLDSINDGIYITDLDRQIIYWNRSAERITGWSAGDVIGKHCHDDVLCHEDKDGHQLCGQEHCPLHRAIITDTASTSPIIVFARHKNGGRVPVQVSVAPVRTVNNVVVGGVETFRDLSEDIRDIERAQRIQSLVLHQELPADSRIAFRTYNVQRDMIGGDYYAVAPLGPDRYGFFVADVCGHGVPAALYPMCLRSMWESYGPQLDQPSRFAAEVSRNLCHLVADDAPFAAAICGAVDLAGGTLRITGAGLPPPLFFPAAGEPRIIDCSGLPFGMFDNAQYTETTLAFQPADRLLIYTDGATEVRRADDSMLGTEGLLECLARLGYPRAEVAFEDVEEALLLASDRIRFDDDLSFLEIRRP